MTISDQEIQGLLEKAGMAAEPGGQPEAPPVIKSVPEQINDAVERVLDCWCQGKGWGELQEALQELSKLKRGTGRPQLSGGAT